MTIEDFKKAKIEAMKAKDKDTVTGLNTLISKLMLAQIEKRAKGENMTDADVFSVLKKTYNELVEEKDVFEKANRKESVESLKRQIASVEKYLPKLMSENEIKEIILKMEDKSIPTVMRKFKTEYAGKCDMKMVNDILKKL